MKKLILFTLFAVGVYGQDNMGKLFVSEEIDWLDSQKIEAFTLNNFIELWDEYKAKCYADSVPVVNQSFRTYRVDTDPVYVYRILPPDTIGWFHKPTNGFEGFMEYLRGKMK